MALPAERCFGERLLAREGGNSRATIEVALSPSGGATTVRRKADRR